jgi:hypothetical protein
MTIKIIIMVLIPSLCLYLTGCYSMHYIPKEDLKNSSYSKLWVLTNNGDSYLFKDNAYLLKNDTLYGRISNKNQPSFKMNIPLKDISSMQTEKINGGYTFLAVLGVFVIVAGIAFLIKGMEVSSTVNEITL